MNKKAPSLLFSKPSAFLIVDIKELMGGMGINSIEALRGNRLMLRGVGLTDKELEILGISHAGE